MKKCFLFHSKVNPLFRWTREEFWLFCNVTFFFWLEKFWVSFVKGRSHEFWSPSSLLKSYNVTFFTCYPNKVWEISSKYFLIQPNKGWGFPNRWITLESILWMKEFLIHFPVPNMPKEFSHKTLLARLFGSIFDEDCGWWKFVMHLIYSIWEVNFWILSSSKDTF